MWTRTEISELAQTLNTFKLEEILNESELEAIPSTAIPNLRSHLFEPKHNRDVSNLIRKLRYKNSLGKNYNNTEHLQRTRYV